MSHNAHTGARMISKPANDNFESGWDRLWGKKQPEKLPTCVKCPTDEGLSCKYCGLCQETQTYAGWTHLFAKPPVGRLDE